MPFPRVATLDLYLGRLIYNYSQCTDVSPIGYQRGGYALRETSATQKAYIAFEIQSHHPPKRILPEWVLATVRFRRHDGLLGAVERWKRAPIQLLPNSPQKGRAAARTPAPQQKEAHPCKLPCRVAHPLHPQRAEKRSRIRRNMTIFARRTK